MSGTVVFNNLGASQDDQWEPAADASNGLDGQSFTAAQTSTISQVVLNLSDNQPSDGGSLTVELYSNSTSNSASVEIASLGTIQDSSISSTSSNNTINVAASPTLTSGAQYWIVLAASENSNATWYATFSQSGTGVSGQFQETQGSSSPVSDSEAFIMSVTTEAACYAAGTHILTPDGEVPVEALRPGDRVVTARHGRGAATVRWVGRRRLWPARHPRPWAVNPVRVRAGALGPGRPHRDLLLSPDHALFLDGVLARARDLLNGATVAQETVDEITYYHVELDRHDLLLAEGAAAESFLDTGNRAAFENGGAVTMAHADFARSVWASDACAELVLAGPRLEAIRARIAARAEALGWALTDDPDLRLVAADRTLRLAPADAGWHLHLPPGTGTARLLSRTVAPAHVLPGAIDTRRLGVALVALALDGCDLPLDGPAFGAGWLAPEPGLRWTTGDATLHTDGARLLTLRIAPILRYWDAPDAARRAA